jgi:hypothetical protein
LLSLFEGQTLDFLVQGYGTEAQKLQAKVLRAGTDASSHRLPTQPWVQGRAEEPALFEVEGKVRLQMPGLPLFPPFDPKALESRLEWTIESEKGGRAQAELVYLTRGVGWRAEYSLLASDAQDSAELRGLATIDNQSGGSFPQARLTLVAGDVSKRLAAQPTGQPRQSTPSFVKETPNEGARAYSGGEIAPLKDRSTRQVEILPSQRVATRTLYIYDGVKVDMARFPGWTTDTIRQQSSFGTDFTGNVAVVKEVANTSGNGLGKPLPMGTLRYYRRVESGGLALLGEMEVADTAAGDTLRVPAGTAPDLTGERRRLTYTQNQSGGSRTTEESFEIVLKNAGRTPATVTVVEHLYRGSGGKILSESEVHVERDPLTLEYQVTVPAAGQKTITYLVRYPQ